MPRCRIIELHNTEPGHRKFWRLTHTVDYRAARRTWGKIGTSGQMTRTADPYVVSEYVGTAQTKLAKGYGVFAEFTIDVAVHPNHDDFDTALAAAIAAGIDDTADTCDTIAVFDRFDATVASSTMFTRLGALPGTRSGGRLVRRTTQRRAEFARAVFAAPVDAVDLAGDVDDDTLEIVGALWRPGRLREALESAVLL